MHAGSGPPVNIEHVSMSYDTGSKSVPVLKDVDLRFAPGESICLLGPSGSGKSTLLHLLAALHTPKSGRILVGDQDLSELDLDSAAQWRRTHVGFVHQFFNLIPTFTLVQNIAVPMLLEGHKLRNLREPISELLDQLGIGHRREHKLDELSGGELQRVAIARALITGAGLLLADEPTGNLDSASGAEIMTLFRDLNRDRGVTIVVATHDMGWTSYADRVIRIRDGRVYEDSSHERSTSSGPVTQ